MESKNNNGNNFGATIWTIGWMFYLGLFLDPASITSFWSLVKELLATFIFWPFLLGLWLRP